MHRNGKIYGERCDVCGKLTRSKDGYYLKPDGVSAGYMHSQEWYGLKAVDDGTDICEECAARATQSASQAEGRDK